jgi:CheY-like chemotaxis protein
MTRNGQRLLLLIDDEPAQRRLIAALAQRGGWRTLFATDADMAASSWVRRRGASWTPC